MIQKWLGPGLIAAFAVYLLGAMLHPQLEANADTERDLFRAHALVELGEWPDQGPAIDHLPLTLGPGWYLMVAPPLKVSPNPSGVHWWHVAIAALGLVVLFLGLKHTLGGGYAFAVVVLIASSSWLAAVMTKIWHNAMLPGVAFLWLGVLAFALSTRDPKRQGWALLGMWILTLLLLQLHVLGLAYLAPLFVLHIFSLKRHGRALGVASVGLSILIALGLVISTGIALSGLDWSALSYLREQRAGGGLAVLSTLTFIPLMLVSAWHSWLGEPWAWLLLVFAAVGLVNAFRSEDRMMRWVAIQMLLGLIVAMALSSINVAPRYFSAVIPSLLILVGLGLKELIAPQFGGILAVVVVILSVMPGHSELAREDGVLTLFEQQNSLAAMADVSCNDAIIRRQSHGLVSGPLQATNYLTVTEYGDSKCVSKEAQSMTIGVPGFPLPPGKRSQFDGGSGRLLTLVVGPERVDYKHIKSTRGGKPCAIRIPYRWSHLSRREMDTFRIFSGPRLDHCAPGSRLTLSVPAVRGNEPLYLLLSWYDLSRRHWENAGVSATSSDGTALKLKRVATHLLRFAAMYEIPSTSRPFRLHIEPAASLAVIDLF